MTLLRSTLNASTAVYRFYDADGCLLYVGVAIDPKARFACHAREKVWWKDVDQTRTRIDWYPNRHSAITAENQALDTESPMHNVSGTTNLPVPSHMREPRSYDDIRRLRVQEDLWGEYVEIVGNRRVSADLKAYIDWRLDNPTTPLPGRRRVAPPKVRKSRTEEPRADD